jgi:AraC-like DNA-binding protein
LPANAVSRLARGLCALAQGMRCLLPVAEDAPPAPCGGLAPHKLRHVRSYIADHLCEAIRVDQLADAVHLSPFHFARMFKQSTGASPHQHILMQRIERARELLCVSDSALVDVAAEVGFRTQGHFTGVFHRYTGFTPRAFRLVVRAAAGSPGAAPQPSRRDPPDPGAPSRRQP